MQSAIRYLATEGQDVIIAEVIIAKGLVMSLFLAGGTRVGKHAKLRDDADLISLAESCHRDLTEAGLEVRKA